MITKPMDVLANYPIRKSSKQKNAFISAVVAFAESAHYSVQVETGPADRKETILPNSPFASKNIVLGDPQKAKFLITAHYDTGNVSPMSALILPYNILLQMLYVFILLMIVFTLSVGFGLAVSFLLGAASLAIPICLFSLAFAFLLCFAVPLRRPSDNYGSSGVVALLEIAASVPTNLRSRVCFVLLDKSSGGFIGAECYRKRHKHSDNQIVIQLDCLGEGDELILFTTKHFRQDQEQILSLSKICGQWGKKSIILPQKCFTVYPSDYGCFPNGVCIAAFHRNKIVGPYVCHFHEKTNRELDETNLNIVRAALITLIGAAEK